MSSLLDFAEFTYIIWNINNLVSCDYTFTEILDFFV